MALNGGPQDQLTLKEFLVKEVSGVTDLLGLVISDRDGIPVAQEWINKNLDLQSKFANNSQVTAGFHSKSEQANKLGLGNSDVFIACYEKYQLIQISEMNKYKCVITLFAKANCNTGLLLEKRETWRRLAEVVYKNVLSTSRHPVMT